MTEIERVIEFAKSESISFDSICFECEWNNYKVYSPEFNVESDYFIGLPRFILIDKQDKIRLADTDEIYEILESLPDEIIVESNNVIHDGSNELASHRLDLMIHKIESEENQE